MALIAQVRDNAKRGHSTAIRSYELMREYVKAHPVPELDHAFNAGAKLSHMPILNNPRIKRFLSSFGAEEKAAFTFGMKHKHNAKVSHRNPNVSRAIHQGKIVGHARRLQAVRMPGSSLEKFDSRVGWELGEDC